MARYTGPMTRKSRRLGTDLVGNSKSYERRPFPPGMHGRGRTKDSEYSQQLKEKQKARFAYGVMEKQFRRYYEEATRSSAKTGDILLQILESRLDNVVYRAGFATTRRQARQLVSHGHFQVNGQRVNIPSYRVRAQDIVDVVPKSANLHPIVVAREVFDSRTVPAWMDSRPTAGRIIIHALPIREQIVIDLQEQLIVELYSR
ncbi:MAG: 30S ribosomal protein S4 [Propionibacteriaceae bacterium]|nr:30S ribosomal protein S4 [Propionibacteriaceae bacterium]